MWCVHISAVKPKIAIVQKQLTTDSLVQYFSPKCNFVLIWLSRLLLIRQISTHSGTNHLKPVFLEVFSQPKLMSCVSFGVGKEKNRETHLLPKSPD